MTKPLNQSSRVFCFPEVEIFCANRVGLIRNRVQAYSVFCDAKKPMSISMMVADPTVLVTIAIDLG